MELHTTCASPNNGGFLSINFQPFRLPVGLDNQQAAFSNPPPKIQQQFYVYL